MTLPVTLSMKNPDLGKTTVEEYRWLWEEKIGGETKVALPCKMGKYNYQQFL